MGDAVFDLFGNPWVDAPKKRGRPPHVVTVQTRKRVSMLLALGWSTSRIAAVLTITLPTLHKYYFYELRQQATARDMLEARRFELAWQAAEAGNVGAMREVGRLMERNDRMEAERAFVDKPAAEKPAKRLGKKVVDEQLARDADADLMAELEREATAQNAVH